MLEQIKAQPRCWTPRQDGLVEPSLNRFDFSDRGATRTAMAIRCAVVAKISAPASASVSSNPVLCCSSRPWIHSKGHHY